MYERTQPEITEKEPRSKEGDDFILELRGQVAANRSNGFNRVLLQTIEENPHLTIRACWEQVEKDFAAQRMVKARLYPHEFDN